ncbi:MAG: transposase [Candidatus Aminicenantaceae bacterium]
MATRKNHTGIFKKILVEFINEEDPMLAILKWTAQQMMQIEAEAKIGARKGEHCEERKTYFSGTRVRRMDTRLGTVYLTPRRLSLSKGELQHPAEICLDRYPF